MACIPVVFTSTCKHTNAWICQSKYKWNEEYTTILKILNVLKSTFYLDRCLVKHINLFISITIEARVYITIKCFAWKNDTK